MELLELIDALYEKALVPSFKGASSKSPRSKPSKTKDSSFGESASPVVSEVGVTFPALQQASDWKGHLSGLALQSGLELKVVALAFKEQKARCGVSGLKLSYDLGDLCCAVLLRRDQGIGWEVGNLLLVCRWVRDGGGLGLGPVIAQLRGGR